MNILYVTNSRFPSERAHSVQIVKMCNAFAAIGHAVTLAVTNRATDITESAENYYGDSFSFVLHRVPVVDLAQYGEIVPSALMRLLYFIQRLCFVRNLVVPELCDYIYGRDPVILYLLGRRHGFSRIVYESHEAHFNWFVRRLLRRQVRLVVISEGIRDFYIQKGVPQQSILVAHDAIDASFLTKPITAAESRSRLGIETDKPLVLYIGGFGKEKGIDTFLEASRLLPDAQFAAIGGSPEQVASYEQRYSEVLFLGTRPYRELVYNQQAADVLVIPNSSRTAVSASYTSPLKLFAHLASHVPLVVSRVPSLRAVVSEQEVWFADPDNPDSFANVIASVLASQAEAASRAVAAKQLSKRYTWSERARQIVDFLVR